MSDTSLTLTSLNVLLEDARLGLCWQMGPRNTTEGHIALSPTTGEPGEVEVRPGPAGQQESMRIYYHTAVTDHRQMGETEN